MRSGHLTMPKGSLEELPGCWNFYIEKKSPPKLSGKHPGISGVPVLLGPFGLRKKGGDVVVDGGAIQRRTWRIIPISKWLVTPIYKPFSPFVRGTTLLRGLTITMVINHVTS